MNQQKVPFDKLTVVRLFRYVTIFASSESGLQAKLMFAGLIVLLLGINGTNVLNSYVGRDFMTAIKHRNKAQFIEEALLYIGVFAASTVVAVISRFTEERLGLLWREFLTRRGINKYLDEGTYYRLQTAEGLANPDERIAEDIRAFTVTTLSFVLMLLNSAFTVIAFSGVLWLISPLLFGGAVIYAACGSYVTLVLSRPLIKLNYDQFDKEADFRSGLIHVRENAESILLARREDRLKVRLQSRLDNFVTNFRAIISINRNVGFFTTGYNLVDPDHSSLDRGAVLHRRANRVWGDHPVGHGLHTNRERTLTDRFPSPVTLQLRRGGCPTRFTDRGCRAKAGGPSSGYRDEGGRRACGLRRADFAVGGGWPACAQGAVDINPIRKPDADLGRERDREGGVVQGDRRAMDHRQGTGHTSGRDRHIFSGRAALLATGYLARSSRAGET
jgi:ABC transporter transmembrane region 2